MAGARALWVATGMKQEQFGKPIIAIVNSFTQFVPGHTHLHEIGQIVREEIEKMGCYAAEFNTIAIDDGIAMGHDGMLYSLPSRDIIADSVEYMVNAHKADAMICISNCDKVTPGMLMASMRLNIPTVFCSGGPMEAGRWRGENADLITAMVKGADPEVTDEEMKEIEACACPGCGSCSGMFTANSMNSLTEAIGLSLPGNGTILATHANRVELFKAAARQVVKNAFAYYIDGNESVLPRNIATRQAFMNAMALDIAMGGSTNTVLHLLAVDPRVPYRLGGDPPLRRHRHHRHPLRHGRAPYELHRPHGRRPFEFGPFHRRDPEHRHHDLQFRQPQRRLLRPQRRNSSTQCGIHFPQYRLRLPQRQFRELSSFHFFQP